MAVTRHVTKAKLADLPREEDEDRIEFLQVAKNRSIEAETLDVSPEQVFTVTKPVNFNQLSNELEQYLGVPVHLAAQQPPGPEVGVIPEPSKDYPMTLYVSVPNDDGDSVSKNILKVLDEHKADSNWRDPALR